MRTLVGVAALTLALVATARAESPAEREARVEYATAQKAFEAARYDDALAGYQHAYALSHYPAILYRVALCQELLGRRSDAATTYEQYLAADPKSERRDAVTRHIAELRSSEQPPPKTVEPTAPVGPTAPPKPAEPTPAPPVAAAIVNAPPAPLDRPPPKRSHRALWIGLGIGLGVAALAGAAIAIGVTQSHGTDYWSQAQKGCPSCMTVQFQ